MLPPLRAIILDTETTGFVPKTHRIIELAWVLVEDGRVVREFESLLSIPDPIPPMVEVLTHIATEDLQGKPTFADVVGELQAALTPETIVIGQNIPFDISMVKGEGLDLSGYPTFDTAMLASLAFPEARSFSLSYLSRILGLPHEPVHRALGDVRATTALLEACWQRFSELSDEQLTAMRTLFMKSSPGYQALAAVLPAKGTTKAPAWLKVERGRPTERSTEAIDLALPAVGSVVIREQTVGADSIGQLLSTPLGKKEKRRIIAVKNLESTLRQVVLPKDAAAIYPAQFLLESAAKDRLLAQESLTADEASIALKLSWYSPRVRREIPLHGDERSVWSGVLAATRQSDAYRAQFKDLPALVLIDHQQLLQFASEESAEAADLLGEGTHVVITDASMLEDTATRAFGAEVNLDDLRAASQGHAGLTSLSDLLAIYVEKLGGEDIRYLVPNDLESYEAKGLREKLQVLTAEAGLPERTKHLLAQVVHILQPDALVDRLAWVERRRGGGLFLHSAPEKASDLLAKHLYACVLTTLLMPPGKEGDEVPVVPLGTKSERIAPLADAAPIPLDLSGPMLDELLRSPPEGKTIVLLGSKRAIEMAFIQHTEKLEEKGVTLICQGMSGGQGRMEAEFLAAEGATIWLLTPWTYEGSELPKDSVDHLIIETLPFDHPSHPVLGRRAMRFRDGFGDYMMPRLEQRLFRLLRTFAAQRRSGGDAMMLDRRLFGKDYGKRIQAYLGRIAAVKDAERTPTVPPVPAVIHPKPAQKKPAAKKPAKAKGNEQQLPLL